MRLNLKKLFELRDDILTGKSPDVYLTAVSDQILWALSDCRNALRAAPCTCRPAAVLQPDGTRTKLSCLRCDALENFDEGEGS